MIFRRIHSRVVGFVTTSKRKTKTDQLDCASPDQDRQYIVYILIPTEMRNAVGDADLARPSSPAAAWVMVAGCEINSNSAQRPASAHRTLRSILFLSSDPVSGAIIVEARHLPFC